MKKDLITVLIMMMCTMLTARIMSIQTDNGIFTFDLDDIEYIDFSGMNSVEDLQFISQINFELKQNYPNPFGKSVGRSNSTTISFNLKKSGQTELVIYNIKGQKVKSLLNSRLEYGNHTVNWDGKNSSGQLVSSGVYFYKLDFGGSTISQKMILIK